MVCVVTKAQLVPQAREESLDKMGHLVHLEREEQQVLLDKQEARDQEVKKGFKDDQVNKVYQVYLEILDYAVMQVWK